MITVRITREEETIERSFFDPVTAEYWVHNELAEEEHFIEILRVGDRKIGIVAFMWKALGVSLMEATRIFDRVKAGDPVRIKSKFSKVLVDDLSALGCEVKVI